MDLEYWNEFYRKKRAVSARPSSFALFCNTKYMSNASSIMELGSGNGRDAIYFAQEGHRVYALDQSRSASSSARMISNDRDYGGRLKFIEADFTDNDFEKYPEVDVIYSRFTLHAITPDEQDAVLENAYNKLSPGGLFCIEARTIRDPLYGVGEELSKNQFITDHYRRFLDPRAVITQCFSLGYNLKYMIESSGLSVVKDDNAVLMRLILSRDK